MQCCISLMQFWHHYLLSTVGSKCTEDSNIGYDLPSLAKSFLMPNLALLHFGNSFCPIIGAPYFITPCQILAMTNFYSTIGDALKSCFIDNEPNYLCLAY